MAMHMKKMVLLANNFSYDGEILDFKHFKQRLLIKPHTSLPHKFHFKLNFYACSALPWEYRLFQWKL